MELKDTAITYFDQGVPVVAVRQKKPLIDWARWQTNVQTAEELKNMPWSNADGFAIICGSKLHNGLYIGAVDFDVKNVSEEAQEKGQQILKNLLCTQMEQTPSGGQHWIYHCHKKPRTANIFHNEFGLEILGEGKLCIMAPSQGYRRLNDNTPTVVNDLEDSMLQAIWKAGIKLKEQKKGAWFDREDSTFKPYTGADPYCIRQLLKGVHEGKRNEAAIRLSSYFVNFKQLNPTTSQGAWKHLRDWNKLNMPPLNETELKSIYDSAIKGEYNFGCEDSVLKSFCDPEVTCPLRKKQEKSEFQKPVFDQETEQRIEAAVDQICMAENQLEALKPHLDRVLVGEDDVKVPIFVLLLGSKYKAPEFKQIILIKATEGSGKSTLIRNLAEGYKVKDVGRFSAHALDYSNLDGYEILSLKELGNMDMEKQGVSTIKFLSSDDRGYNVEITIKDEATGKFKTETYTIPCITVVSTTTRLVLDSQFERRAWLFSCDESEQQTARIAKWKAQVEREKAEVLLGRRKITSLEFSREVIRRFVAQIKPVKVVIPFPETLSELLGYEVLRIRGDIDKLYVFVKFYAALNVKRLQKLGDDVYAVTPQVCMEALRYAEKPLIGMLSKMDERTRVILPVLKTIKDVREKTGERGEEYEDIITYDVKGSQIDKRVREQIAVKINRSERTVREFFSSLENGGYISSDQKKPKTYTLLYDIEEIEEKLSGISAKFKLADILMDKMAKEAQSWLRIGLEIKTPVDRERSLFETQRQDKPAQQPRETLVKPQRELLPTAGEKISNPSLASKRPVSGESGLESRLNDNPPIPRSEEEKAAAGLGLIPCPYCRSQGRKMFFASDIDLRAHISTFHEPQSYTR